MSEVQEPRVQEDGGDEDEGGGFRIHVSMEDKLVIAKDTADKLFTLLGAGVPTIAVEAEEDQIIVRLQELAPALTPSGDTRVLESIQFILSKAVNKLALRRTRLSLDADGFRRRRPEGLDRIAEALAAKALQLGKPLAIGPLGQSDLRLLATLAGKTPGISTQAVGPHHLRRLVLLPALAGTAESPGSGSGSGSAPAPAPAPAPEVLSASDSHAETAPTDAPPEEGIKRRRRRT